LIAKSNGDSICEIEDCLNFPGTTHGNLVVALALWTRILPRSLCEIEDHAGGGHSGIYGIRILGSWAQESRIRESGTRSHGTGYHGARVLVPAHGPQTSEAWEFSLSEQKSSFTLIVYLHRE
jgi:hypothetical protein